MNRPALADWLGDLGHVVSTIAGHDSGCTSYLVDDGTDRLFVKVAGAEARWQLDRAVTVHERVRHPVVVPLRESVDLADGFRALVYPWVEGENLHDPHVPGALPREHPESSQSRFRRLPDRVSWATFAALLDAHVAVAAAGLIAVDLYDGCLIFDHDTGELHLIDVDLYSPPYVLDRDRQYGSSRLMAPEEFRRGAWIEETATVFTLARLAAVLACARTGAQQQVVARATQPHPPARFQTVAALALAWDAATQA